jgi:4'-phosphopantetheinyl transferase EntD
MIEQILPQCVSAFDVRSDCAPDLFPVERAYVSRAVDTRKREFSTARRCAREALSGLGITPQAIGVGEHGQPLWPTGCVGSITHCLGYRGSAVGLAIDLAGIGIDAELNNPLAADLMATIALPAEIERLHRLSLSQPEIHWTRLLFSAKESIYKALFPMIGRQLNFEDADIEIDPGGTFLAKITSHRRREDVMPIYRLQGRWVAIDGLLLTSVAIQL